MINPSSLFEGNKIVLTAPKPDEDAQVEAEWSRDADYLALIQPGPVRPLTAAQILKNDPYNEKSDKLFAFAIRSKAEQRLVGMIDLYSVMSWNGVGSVRIRIGSPADRGKGYGREALALVLRYAFHELNLHRLSAWIMEYNLTAQSLFRSAGFVPEVRQRDAILRFGRRWDMLLFGLLKRDWEAGLTQQKTEVE